MYEVNAIYDILHRAIKHNNAIIDIEQGRTIKYYELVDLTEHFASYLADELGMQPGERVAILLPNSWQYVVSFYALSMSGCIAVPIDYRLTEREVSFIINDSGASLLICDQTFEAKLPQVKKVIMKEDIPRAPKAKFIPIKQTSPLCILYTGGTTGRQKGALLTHANFISVLSRLSEAWCLKRGEERFLQFLPMTHSGGLNCGVNSSIFCSGCTVIMEKFDPLAVLELVQTFNITVMPGVPTVYNELVKTEQIKRKDVSSLRICFSSGASLPRPVAERFREITGITINVGWGLTEASPQLTVCPLGVYIENMVGLPLRDTTVLAFDNSHNPLPPGKVGELGAKGPQIMVKYWNRDEETRAVFTKDGFLLTGDIGYVGPDGFVYLLGRKKNMINTGGYKVWPEEVESIILENPKVKEVAVIGVPDEKFGETIKAFVVPREEMSKEELLIYLRGRIAGYKIPRHIEFRRELPKSSLGKILHRVLREQEKSNQLK